MRRLALGVLILCAIGSPATAQTVNPPIEGYGHLPSLAQATISPSGQNIALLQNLDEGVQVRIFDIATGQITQGFDATHLKAHSVEFSDNEHVVIRASELKEFSPISIGIFLASPIQAFGRVTKFLIPR